MHFIRRFGRGASFIPSSAAAVPAGIAALALLAAAGRADASYLTTVQASNPSSYYRLEETSGTSAADLGTRNLSATLAGGFTLNQPGIPGGDPTDRAVSFNGTSGFATVAGAYTGTSYPLSIEAFVKTTNATSTNQKVSGLTNNATGVDNVGVYVQSGKAALRIRNSASDQSFQGSTPVTISDGNFHQIVGVFDSATQRELYVDGVLVTASTANAAFPVINSLDIGALARNTTADFLNGTVDEVSVYPTALSASTVASHYAASVVPEPASVGLLAVAGAAALAARRRHFFVAPPGE